MDHSSPSDDSGYSSPLSSPTTSSPSLASPWRATVSDEGDSNSSPAGILKSTPQPDSGSRPKPTKAPSTSSRRYRSPSHIPRPRNAFMIFRSEFYKYKTIDSNVEHDHRLISQIIGHCWRQLSDSEREMYKARAKEEADAHKLKYPDYRFRPVHRKTPPQRRKVKRNELKDKIRCQEIAFLIRAGYHGRDLKQAAEKLDDGLLKKFDKKPYRPAPTTAPRRNNEPAFRSPLLAPVVLDEVAKFDTRSFSHTAPFVPNSPVSPIPALSLSPVPPLPTTQSLYESISHDTSYTLNWCDGSSSSIMAPPSTRQMIHDTSAFLQQDCEEPLALFDLPPLPQYLTTISHPPPVSSSPFQPYIPIDFLDRPQPDCSLAPLRSYHYTDSDSFPAQYTSREALSPSAEWSSRDTQEYYPTTASEAASQRISMAAQLHERFNPSFTTWQTNC